MAKIKFENGITVNFDGNPTQQDIEEVWNSVKDQKSSAKPTQQPTSQPEKKGFDFKKGIQGVKDKILDPLASGAMGVIGGAYEATGNMVKVSDYINPVSWAEKAKGKITGQRNPTFGEFAQKETAQGADFIRGQTPEAFGEHKTAQATGEFVGKVLPQVALGQAVTAPVVTAARGALPATGAIAKTVPFLARSGMETVGYSGANRGELPTKTELATGLAFDTAAAGVSAGLNKLGNFLFSTTIPKSLKERTKQMMMGTDPGEAVSKTGVSMNQKSVYKKLVKESQKVADDVADMISPKETGAVHQLDDVIGDLKNKVKENKSLWRKLKLSPIDEKKAFQVIDDISEQYRELYPDGLTLKALDDIKSQISTGLQTEFNRALTATVRAAPAAEMEVRKSIVDYLDKEVPGYKAKMTEWAPILEAKGILKKKGAGYSRYLTSLIGGAAYAGGSINPIEATQKAASDPLKFVTDFLTGAVLTKAATSTLAKTTAGSLAKKTANQLTNEYGKTGLRNLLLDLLKDSSQEQTE